MFSAIKEKLLDFPVLKEDLHPCIPVTDGKEKRITDKIRLVQIEEETRGLLSKVSGAGSVLMKYIDKRVSELDAEHKALLEKAATTKDTGYKSQQITNHIKLWETLSFEDRQAVTDILVSVIRISNGNLEITWNI